MLSKQWLNVRFITPAEAGWQGVSQFWSVPLGIALLWYVAAYFFYQNILDSVTDAHPITRSEAPKLYNLLENLCISRGLPTPRIYIIETDALNAFASGLSPKSYAITVTRGLIDTLTDEEIEAVLGHELTHIINRDVSLMMTGIIFTGMLALVCDSIYRTFRYTDVSREKKAGSIILIAFVVFLIGRLFAVCLRFALSRRREFLADEGSVELTKNPTALITALQKISVRSQLPHISGDVSQMCIADAEDPLWSLFSTHPSIHARIHALEIAGGTAPPSPSSEPTTVSPWKAGSVGDNTDNTKR